MKPFWYSLSELPTRRLLCLSSGNEPASKAVLAGFNSSGIRQRLLIRKVSEVTDGDLAWSRPLKFLRMTRRRRNPPPAMDYTALQNYEKRKPKVEVLFNEQLRMLRLQQMRLKEHCHTEANLTYDPVTAKQAIELAKAVSSLGQMFFKIQETARHAAESMSVEEQIEVVVDMVRNFGRNNRYKFWRTMRALEVELNDEDRLAPSQASEPEQPIFPDE